jgi:ribosomal protein S18 acetylase RimI-like enzyme
MAVDTALRPSLTLALEDDLAAAPARGVERVVDDTSRSEAAALLGIDADVLARPHADAWLLRDGAQPISALAAEPSADGVAVTMLATAPGHRRRGHAEQLLRAVLGHYALEGVPAATLTVTPEAEALCRRLGATNGDGPRA